MDPVETGLLPGVLMPAAGLVQAATAASIRVRPDFEEEVFSGYVKADLRIYPIKMLIPSVRFFFSPSSMVVIRNLVRNRK